MKVILVEDEKSARDNMLALLRELDPDIKVLACLESIQQSVDWLSANKAPDLAFFDIHLSDGSSFQIFDQIEVQFPVVFTTAYSEYSLKAFKVNSIDYLLKPIKKAELEFSLNKFKNLKAQYKPKIGKDLLTVLQSTYPQGNRSYKQSILIKKYDGFLPIRTDDIACFYIDSGILYCQLIDLNVYAIHEKLEAIEADLNPNDFFRINRQTLVSRRTIKEVSNHLGGRLLIKPRQNIKEKLFVSKGRVAEFRRWLEE